MGIVKVGNQLYLLNQIFSSNHEFFLKDRSSYLLVWWSSLANSYFLILYFSSSIGNAYFSSVGTITKITFLFDSTYMRVLLLVQGTICFTFLMAVFDGIFQWIWWTWYQKHFNSVLLLSAPLAKSEGSSNGPNFPLTLHSPCLTLSPFIYLSHTLSPCHSHCHSSVSKSPCLDLLQNGYLRQYELNSQTNRQSKLFFLGLCP